MAKQSPNPAALLWPACHRARRHLARSEGTAQRGQSLARPHLLFLSHGQVPDLLISRALIDGAASRPILPSLFGGSCIPFRFGLGSTDRKSTRLNSSHLGISYAVFCLKKKK